MHHAYTQIKERKIADREKRLSFVVL